MSRITHIQAEFVEFIPHQLHTGKIYISRKYSTATHLCCCGCGLEVVTPFNEAKWSLIEFGNTVSLHPSIGNWSFPCKAHYWILNGSVMWASELSPEWIAEVQNRDYLDAQNYVIETNTPLTVGGRIRIMIRKLILQISNWIQM